MNMFKNVAIDRRSFLFFVGFASTSNYSKALESKVYGKAPMPMIDYLRQKPQDQVDMEINYLSDWSEENQQLSYKRSESLFKKVVSKFPLMPNGNVLEIGSYKGKCLELLCEKYGASKCLGIDIFNYQDHPRKITADIRDYNEKIPLSLGWNQTSTWSANPRSKYAAHKFLKKNLVKGGILIEDNIKWMPSDITLSDLKIIYQDDNFTVFKKV